MKNSSKIIDKEFESLWENDFGGKHFDVIGKTDLREIVEHFYELGCSQTKKEIGEYCYSQLDRLNVCGNPIKLGKRDFLASIMDFCENGDNYPVTEDEPSWKPSEKEIEEMVNERAIKSGTTKSEMAFYRNGIKDAIKRFDLRPPFKPSEEQMGALSWMLENARGNIDFDPLKDLYEQLKKL